MYEYKLVQQVVRKPKAFTRTLRVLMVVFAVIFVIMGITISQGFMLPGFLLVVLYFIYDVFSQRAYEYVLENGLFTVDVIQGKRYRHNAHEINVDQIEVVAPSSHEAVAKYRRKTGSEKLPKYDYTSYDEEIPYYTMIAVEEQVKIKLLLDLDEEMLQVLKREYPDRVFIAP